MPDFHYWFSGAALVFPLSFFISVIIGVIPLMDGKSKTIVFSLLVVALVITGIGWRAAAKQEKDAAIQEAELRAADGSLRTVKAEMINLVSKMNRLLGHPRDAESDVLSRGAPNWMSVAYGELGQKEIVGPQENPRIIQYFSSLDLKKNFRDDADDWASAFVEWSLNKVGIRGPKSIDPFTWLTWGRSLSKPVLGCIVIMSFSGLHHVGFYFGEDEEFVRVLGGNEDDAVRIYRYPKKSVFGYEWPPEESLPNN